MLKVDPSVYSGLKIAIGVIGFLSLVLGAFLVAKPRRAIERQIAVYRRINWKMEPISWDKEIRNTRLMGVVALFCGVLTLILMVGGVVFAADEEENRELGIEMKGGLKPTFQAAGVKAQKKINKYNKAKKEVIEIFDPPVNKKPVKGLSDRE